MALRGRRAGAPYAHYPARPDRAPGRALISLRGAGSDAHAAPVHTAAAYGLTFAGNWAAIPFVSVSARRRMWAWTSS